MTAQQLPEGWQIVKFGEIANQISKRVEPSGTELDIYVGLEHLDPDSLKIKRYGVPSDVAGQKLLVKKGQIIFGKRRAYQRKVAVADWDCICSAHAMVLEAKPGKIIPDFLPFFMQTSEFMKRAVEISEGSLSPTIKWGKLSTQIFTIPSIERQEKLIPLLLSTMKQEKLLASTFDISIRLLRSFKLTKFKNFFDVEKQRRVNLPDGWKALKLAELIRSAPESGLSPNPVDNNVDQFVLNLNCLTRDGFCPNGFKGIKPVDFSDELKLADGDLLVSRSNTPDLVGLAGLYFDLQGRKAIFPDTMWRIDVNEKKISKEYLLNYLLSPYARRELQRIAAGTSGSMKKINKSSFCKIPVPVPPAEEQAAINETIGDFSAVIEIISKKILEIRALRNSLIKTPGLEGF